MTNWRRLTFPRELYLVLMLMFSFCCPMQLTAQEDEIENENTSTSVPAVEPQAANNGLLFSGRVPNSVEELQFMESHVASLAEKVFPATVNIQMGASQGSGVIVSSDGYVLTAAHVIGDTPGRSALLTFMVDGEPKRVYAETLGVQPGAVDSGMLKIKDEKSRFKGIKKENRFEGDFPFVDIGISQDLKLGQWVMAVGHPGGIDTKRGLVVRMGRVIDNRKLSLRTDCTLVGGDSGGPLFDMNGEVVGIHSRIGRTLADNLHVPADVYSEKWDLMSAGVIINGKASLGFSVVDDSSEIESVDKKGPAEKAGLKKGDRIVKIGSTKVADKDEIKAALKKQNVWPNVVVKVVVERGDEQETLKIKAAKR